jgi:hypothetical protein
MKICAILLTNGQPGTLEGLEQNARSGYQLVMTRRMLSMSDWRFINNCEQLRGSMDCMEARTFFFRSTVLFDEERTLHTPPSERHVVAHVVPLIFDQVSFLFRVGNRCPTDDAEGIKRPIELPPVHAVGHRFGAPISEIAPTVMELLPIMMFNSAHSGDVHAPQVHVLLAAHAAASSFGTV